MKAITNENNGRKRHNTIRAHCRPGWLPLALAALSLTRPGHGQTPDAFNPGAGGPQDGNVRALALQPDGRILVGGWFTTLGSLPRNSIGQIEADGDVDASFNPGVNPTFSPFSPPLPVVCLAVQADGKIVVGGRFTMLGGQDRSNIGRLNADGSVDPSFNPGAGDSTNGTCIVDCLAVQTDGKILVGGQFNTLGGQSRTNLGRLNADGSLDEFFNPGADGFVSSLAVQTDGKILVAGGIRILGGEKFISIGRLNPDGTPDTAFKPALPDDSSQHYCLAVQADGRILLSGKFYTLGGQSIWSLGRLGKDGSLDPTFNGAASVEINQVLYPGTIQCLAVQADGRILVGGGFENLGRQSRTNIARLNADGSGDTAFNLRGGDKMLGIPNHAIGRNVGTNSQLFLRANQPLPNYYLYGHLHRPITLPHANGEIIVNGAFPGVDGYSLTEAFNSSHPIQKFFLVHPKFGRSACYDPRLDFPPAGEPYKLDSLFARN